MTAIVVGCGGIGGWLATCLVRMLGEGDGLVLVDGDTFEEKNMDRQLGCDVGTAKVRALRMALMKGKPKVKITAIQGYLGSDVVAKHLDAVMPGSEESTEVIFCGVDNHRARLECLKLADEKAAMAVICANEYTDAEAYVYFPTWQGTGLDPRIFYPEILTDKSDNPLAPPCTGEVLESSPQLALANMSAANYGLWLWYFWTFKSQEITDMDTRDRCLTRVGSSVGRFTQVMVGDA